MMLAAPLIGLEREPVKLNVETEPRRRRGDGDGGMTVMTDDDADGARRKWS